MNELRWFFSFCGLVADPGGNGGGSAGVIRAGTSCFAISTRDRNSRYPDDTRHDDTRPYAARHGDTSGSDARDTVTVYHCACHNDPSTPGTANACADAPTRDRAQSREQRSIR